MFECLKDAVAGRPDLQRIGRYMDSSFLLEVGDTPYHVTVKNGHVTAVDTGPFKMRSWDFAIRASKEVWDVFSSDMPPSGYQDLFAMTRYGHASLDGNTAPLLHNLRYVKELLALPRTLRQETSQ
ncbi:hypothetical protein [Nisaea nitritireducens]|uniref:hypothetical protein n=1 Tax=Nisaea nitritireducens TaxID=568392 RepID=UPI001866FC40|nr:hypothetical protein [Nisaea nitritireducens]